MYVGSKTKLKRSARLIAMRMLDGYDVVLSKEDIEAYLHIMVSFRLDISWARVTDLAFNYEDAANLFLLVAEEL